MLRWMRRSTLHTGRLSCYAQRATESNGLSMLLPLDHVSHRARDHDR